MSLSQNASKSIADRLAWHTASRDQAGIANDLAEGKDIPEVYGLGEAGLFDEWKEGSNSHPISRIFSLPISGLTRINFIPLINF